MNNILSIRDITKIYEKTTAVNHVSLDIPENTIFGLLGPNGAGKTTLIRMITQILVQDSGTIVLKDIPNKERNMYIGYMPEERGLYKKMKVGEQLMYLAQLKNLSKQQAKTEIDYWLQKFGIEDWWNKVVDELSKGMQQKIQFIATIVHNPTLIILDEPFSGLDPINTNLIKDEIFELKQKGKSVIFSTHRMEQVEEICENIALINKGQIILEGEVKNLKHRFKKNKFSLHYVGEPPELQTPIFNVLQQFDHQLEISLNEGFHSNDVLRYFIENETKIDAFNEILPSLNEIFIAEVNKN
ncbi:MAG: ATP-binding cassette domain-containing protein [Chitinophagales bacterium]